MLRVIGALLALVCAEPAMSQDIFGQARLAEARLAQAGSPARHGNIDRPDNPGGGHAIDQQEDPAAEEAENAGPAGPCVWSEGVAGLPAYVACKSGLLDLFSNVARGLMLLAGLLAAALLLMWFYLHRASSAARKAANYIPTAERAYVFGGPTDLDLLPSRPSVRLAMENYGKTPALLQEWLVDFTATEPQGNRPNYDRLKAVPTGEILEPDRLFSPATVFKSDIQAPFFVVGYIKYADVFGEMHMTRFCVGVGADGKAVAAGPPAWNARD
jgi:hypothetical protein